MCICKYNITEREIEGHITVLLHCKGIEGGNSAYRRPTSTPPFSLVLIFPLDRICIFIIIY